jgi:hypothetical protein
MNKFFITAGVLLNFCLVNPVLAQNSSGLNYGNSTSAPQPATAAPSAPTNSTNGSNPSTPQTASATTQQSTPAITNGGTAGGQVVNNPDGTQSLIQTLYCPTPDQLIKNGLYWGTATGNWKSYSESFDNSIVAFIGAQWVGINVGKMVCIYKGNLAMSFPITIQNDVLSQGPTGGLWGSDLGGYRNCHSSNVLDCPFVVKTQSVNMQQIYNSLDFFKGKPNPLTQPN